MQSSSPAAFGAPVRGEPIAIELMNTVWADRDGVHDALATTRDALAWLDRVSDRLPHVEPERGAGPRSLTASDARQLRVLRDSIRLVAAVVTADPRATESHPGGIAALDDALLVINSAAGTLPALLLRRTSGGLVADRRSRTPNASSIAGFAIDAVPLLAGDHPSGDLRGCRAPGCVLYFVQDHPRREWCSPACGNRARVARHYERTRSARRAATAR